MWLAKYDYNFREKMGMNLVWADFSIFVVVVVFFFYEINENLKIVQN